LVYVLTEGKLVAVAADSGTIKGSTKLPGEVSGTTRLLLGGVHLFVTGLDDGSRNAVFAPGAEPQLVWEYDVKGATLPPTFLGTAITLVSDKAMFQISGMGPVQPEPYTPPVTIPAAENYQPGEGVPVIRFEDNVMPQEWLVSTAIEPMSLDIDFLKTVGGYKARPDLKQTVTDPDAKAPFTWREMQITKEHPAFFNHPNFSGGFDSLCVRTAADPSLVKGNRLVNRTLYFYTVINNRQDRYVEPRILTPGGERWNGPDIFGARYFMNGIEVKPDEVVKMSKGLIPILIQVQYTTCNDGGRIWMAPRLLDRSMGAEAEVAEHEHAQKLWDAYQAEKNTRFVLE
jgi:hypothetical protein